MYIFFDIFVALKVLFEVLIVTRLQIFYLIFLTTFNLTRRYFF